VSSHDGVESIDKHYEHEDEYGHDDGDSDWKGEIHGCGIVNDREKILRLWWESVEAKLWELGREKGKRARNCGFTVQPVAHTNRHHK
jgi:hypothetical protein